jgi:hypothetical protein
LGNHQIKQTAFPARTDKDPLLRQASTVKVERSAASNTFRAHSER